ncbi:MAG: cupin domain-containing protein [Rubrobacteraceae bacterium]
MTINRSEFVTEIESLPGGENAVVFDGHEHGSSVSFFITRNKPGTGPGLHIHPYDETFIMQEGEARFTVGEETIEAAAGEIVVVPAGTPHGFVNTGTGALRSVNIHASPRMETDWLE